MSLDLPEELRWLGWVAGAPWPDGDEDAAWETSAAWEAASKEVTALLVKIDEAKRAIMEAYPAGLAGQEMAARYDVFRTGDQSMEALAEAMLAVSNSAFDMGTELQATKITIIVTLCWLAAEIAWAWLFPPTAPATEAAAILTTRSFLKVMQDSVQKTIANIAARMGAPQLERHFWKSLMHGKLVAPTAKGWGVYIARAGEAVAIGGGINASVQVGQIADGKRREFNGKEFGFSVLGGVAGALPAREFGRMLGHFANKGGDKIIAKTGWNLDNAWYRGFRGMMIGSIADGFGAIAGNLAVGVANVATGGNFSDSFLSGEGWVGGFVQGGLVGGARGASVYSGHIPKVGEGITPGQYRRDNWRGAAWFFPKSAGSGFFAPKPKPQGVTNTDGSGHGGGVELATFGGTGGGPPGPRPVDGPPRFTGPPVMSGAINGGPPGGRTDGPAPLGGGSNTGSGNRGTVGGAPVHSGGNPITNTGGSVSNTGGPVQPGALPVVAGGTTGVGGDTVTQGGQLGGRGSVTQGGQLGGGGNVTQGGQFGGGNTGTQGGPIGVDVVQSGGGNSQGQIGGGSLTQGGPSAFTGQQQTTFFTSDSGSDTTSVGGWSPQNGPLTFGDNGQVHVNGAFGEGGDSFVSDTRAGGQENRPLHGQFTTPFTGYGDNSSLYSVSNDSSSSFDRGMLDANNWPQPQAGGSQFPGGQEGGLGAAQGGGHSGESFTQSNQFGHRDGESEFGISPPGTPVSGSESPFVVSPPGTPMSGESMSGPPSPMSPAPGFTGFGDRDGTGEAGFGGRQHETGGFGGDRSGQQAPPLSSESGPVREPGFVGVPFGGGAPLGGHLPIGHGAPVPPGGDNAPPHSPNQNSGSESTANRDRRMQLPKLVTTVQPPGRADSATIPGFEPVGSPVRGDSQPVPEPIGTPGRGDSPTIPGFEPIGQPVRGDSPTVPGLHPIGPPGGTQFRPTFAPLGIDGSARPLGATPLAAPTPIAPGGNRPTFLDPPTPSTPGDPPNFLNLTPTPPPGHPPTFLDLTPTPSPPPGPPPPPPITGGDDGTASSGASIATNNTSHSTVSGTETVAGSGAQGNLAAQHGDDKRDFLGHGKDLRGKPRPQRWPNWPHMPLPFTAPDPADQPWIPEEEPTDEPPKDPNDTDPEGAPTDPKDTDPAGTPTDPKVTDPTGTPSDPTQPVARAGVPENDPASPVDVPFTLGRPPP